MRKFVCTYYLDGNPEPIRQRVNARTTEEAEKLLHLLFADRRLEIVRIEEIPGSS